MNNPLTPNAGLLAKLGSLIIHAEEMLSPAGHGVDKVALEAGIADPEVQAWLAEMRALAMLPVKR